MPEPRDESPSGRGINPPSDSGVEWTDPVIVGDRVLCDCGADPLLTIAASTGDRRGDGVGMVAAACIDHVDDAFAAVRRWIDHDAADWAAHPARVWGSSDA